MSDTKFTVLHTDPPPGNTLENERAELSRAGAILETSAGDEGRFVRTAVGDCEVATNDVAAVTHVFSRTPWGVGIGHGLGPTTKNLLATVMNAAAFVGFCVSGDVHWPPALAMAIGSVAGGFFGSWLLLRAPEKLLRGAIIVIGTALTLWLFLR